MYILYTQLYIYFVIRSFKFHCYHLLAIFLLSGPTLSQDLNKRGSYWSPLFPDGSAGKEYTCNAGDAGDTGSILGSGRSPGEGNGNPLQYSCLADTTDRGAERLQSTGSQKSQTQPSNSTTTGSPLLTLTYTSYHLPPSQSFNHFSRYFTFPQVPDHCFMTIHLTINN